MEKRALTILYTGTEIPQNVIERIMRAMSTWCGAKDTVQIYTFTENDIVKLLAKSALSENFDDATAKCKNGDEAINIILKTCVDENDIAGRDPVREAVNLYIAASDAADHVLANTATNDELKLIQAIRTVGQGCIHTTNVGYTRELHSAVCSTYIRIFHKDGTLKKR